MAGRKERGEDWRREKIDELRSHVPLSTSDGKSLSSFPKWEMKILHSF
jgi:hypothetical protein